MRDPLMTGYAPKPVEGITPDQRIEVQSRKVACDGEAAATCCRTGVQAFMALREGAKRRYCSKCSLIGDPP